MNASPLSNICQEMKEGKRSTTDLVWSLKIFNIDRTLVNKNEPVLYHLNKNEPVLYHLNKNEPVLYHLKDGPKRGFVGEELQIGPPGMSCLKETNKEQVSQQI